jgi:hypothetical protein
MAIFVTIEDKEGEQIGAVFELRTLQRHFSHIENSICLRFVSDTEDAAFNQAQLPMLVLEMEELAKKELKREENEELERIISYCRRIYGHKGSSIHFYADRNE